MHAHERLLLARLAYARALGRARSRSTRSTWLGLLTAARNVGAAKREVERGRGRRRAVVVLAQEGGTTPGDADRARRAPVPLHPRTAAAEVDGTHTARGLEGPLRRATIWSEIAAEWERALRLMEQSRALVRQARALCASIDAFDAERRGPPPRRPPAAPGCLPSTA